MTTEWKSRLERVDPDALRVEEVELGRISGVFGVAGEVRLHLHNRDSQLLAEGRDVVLIAGDGERFRAHISSRPGAGRRVLGRIEGIDQPELAREMADVRIVVPYEALPDPAEGEYYLDEIVGMSVCTGDVVHGRVAAVHTTGPIEVFELDTGAYLPSTGDHIVSIDRATRVIEVEPGAVHAL